MSKREIELHFDDVKTSWVMDTEILDGCVLFGFEEHFNECDCHIKDKACISTEQVLDKKDLEMIKLLIDKTLKEMNSVEV